MKSVLSFASSLIMVATLSVPGLALAQDKPAPAYYVSEFTVNSPEGIRPYSAAVDATFAPYGGRYIVRGGKVSPLEGDTTTRIVIIGFDSVEKAQAWYNSPEYAKIRPIRQSSATSRTYIVEGMPN